MTFKKKGEKSSRRNLQMVAFFVTVRYENYVSK